MKMPESAEYVVNHENYFLHDTAHSHTSVRVFGIPSFNESPLSCHARLPTKFDFSWHERYPFQTLMLYVHVCSSEGVSVWVCVCVWVCVVSWNWSITAGNRKWHVRPEIWREFSKFQTCLYAQVLHFSLSHLSPFPSPSTRRRTPYLPYLRCLT